MCGASGNYYRLLAVSKLWLLVDWGGADMIEFELPYNTQATLYRLWGEQMERQRDEARTIARKLYAENKRLKEEYDQFDQFCEYIITRLQKENVDLKRAMGGHDD